MASTSSFLFDPNLATIADEAVERAGLNLQEITGEHIISIRRSAGFMLSSWANRGHRQWTFEQIEHTVVPGEVSFDLPVGSIEVQNAVVRRNGVDTEIYPISREDYLILHDKNLIGRPDRYFIDRRRDTDGTNRVQVFFWLAGENSTDIIIMNVYKQIQDVGNPQNTLDIPFRFQEAFVAELAAKVALKWNEAKWEALQTLASDEWTLAHDEDRDTAPFVMSANYSRLHGRP
ncbi:MAG: hypothetical protein QGD91_09720 [Actinomycetota bacterium]|nr:hypothetical protein [Actinomycetota bacterium]